MSKLDALKEKIATKREYLKTFLLLAIAIMTGISTVVYKVMAHELHIYMLFLVAFGFVALAINVMIVQKIYVQLEEYTEELDNA